MKTNAFYFTLGRPFAPLYGAAMRLREAWYQRNIFRSHRLAAPVISVGNLTLGGTGKTPMVQYLARLLQREGWHPAIISRGYGGAARGKINLVSDRAQLLLPADQAGDEPRFLAETLPGVPVLTGIVRRLPAQRALEMGADVLLLDDGFQHLQIRRDLDLVLFNADRLAGNSRVFPGGELREPVAALRRASRFVLTGVNENNRDRAERFAALLTERFPAIGVTMAGYAVQSAVAPADNGLLAAAPLARLEGRRCLGFAGIARPESFHATLEGLGIALTGFVPLGDHQRYTRPVIRALADQCRKSGAEILVTTEKDLVKLAPWVKELALPLYGLRMEVQADASFAQFIVQGVRAKMEEQRTP